MVSNRARKVAGASCVISAPAGSISAPMSPPIVPSSSEVPQAVRPASAAPAAIVVIRLIETPFPFGRLSARSRVNPSANLARNRQLVS